MADLPSLLRHYADLAAPARKPSKRAVRRRREFHWMGLGGLAALGEPSDAGLRTNAFLGWASHPGWISSVPRELTAADALHPNEHLLALGWGWIAGSLESEEGRTDVLVPLATAPVEVSALGIRRVGDVEVTHLVDDPARRPDLEARVTFGGGALGDDVDPAILDRCHGLLSWLSDVADAAGLPTGRHVDWRHDPWDLVGQDGLTLVVGSGLHLVRDTWAPNLTASLLNWAGSAGLADTALSAVLARDSDGGGDGGRDTFTSEPASDGPIRSHLPLLADQRRLVASARRHRLTGVSGAPGTGKTHALVATALDAVARDETVLVATRSPHAAEVLAGMFDRQPGPTPVLFGSAADRELLAERLTDPSPPDDGRAARAESEASVELEQRLDDLLSQLELDRLAASVPADDPRRALALTRAPLLADPHTDLDDVRALLARARAPRWWHRRPAERLRAAVGADRGTSIDDIAAALDAASALAAGRRLQNLGLEVRHASWQTLAQALERWREAAGEHSAANAADRSRRSREALAEISAALRVGRSQRRARLAELDGTRALRSAPLWIGTLTDIDDLLPLTPGLFDLVLLDEASQIDQPTAATALLRGRRAVVAGDSRQLRHVSFVSDADCSASLAANGLSSLFDVRRNSAHDLVAATGANHVTLRDHVRSAPHLISFSADRFYGERLRILTRHPSNDTEDRISTVRVEGSSNGTGANPAEVDRIIELLARGIAAGDVDVGVVTPFRAQADAIEAAVIEAFPPETIRRARLQVGTVHAFQGSERDTVIASLAALDDDPAGRRRFLDDPHLMNVMLTRAREHLVIVHSFTEPPGGLIGDLLRHAERPPTAARPSGAATTWIDQVTRELQRQGVTAMAGYPVGAWTLDLVIGTGARAWGVNATPHPDGSDAHVERHLTLSDLGWHIIDVSPEWWDDEVAAALELAGLHTRGQGSASATDARRRR